ncbi:MAG: NAD(P)/FAD-dependent oxidoreductase [Flavobacteriales bacterium]
MRKKIIILGGGAAGFFCAIEVKRLNPECSVIILEKTKQLLGKVKISGGGRCNVTHSCFTPKELCTNYPRGSKELRGVFHTFQPLDTISWFEERGVELKTESDGRMFPVTDSSQTIIDTFLNEAHKLGVEVRMQAGARKLEQTKKGWSVITDKETLDAEALVITTGSSTKVWNVLSGMGHGIIEPVPSLFTFNISDKDLHELAGLSIPEVTISLEGTKLSSSGVLLFTHWGVSAPAVLKLSAAAARVLHERDYKFKIFVDFISSTSREDLALVFDHARVSSQKKVINHNPLLLPKRFWFYLLDKANIPEERLWAELRKKEQNMLIELLKRMTLEVNGKSTFKEEFVTSGGVDLRQVNFKTMESKLHKGLYFSGEVLNVDAFTGGFNFQAAWSTAHVAAVALAKKD